LHNAGIKQSRKSAQRINTGNLFTNFIGLGMHVLGDFFQKTGFQHKTFHFVGITFNLFFIIGEADILDDRASF
jgi:hypothetical protein